MPMSLSPDGADTGTSTGPKVSPTADDIVDLLSSDDGNDEGADKDNKGKGKGSEKDDNDDKKGDDKKGKEKEEIELEDDDPDEDADDDKIKLKDADDVEVEDDDVPDDVAPPRLKAIEEAYPGILKKFPFIGKMMARDKQYTELFGSFDDAKQLHSDHQELSEKAEVFAAFEAKLLDGDTTEMLQNIKETDPKAFDRITDDYLLALHKVDKDAYMHVVNGVAKQIIYKLYTEGKESDNDDMKAAAAELNKFLFNTTKFTPHERKTEARKEGDKKDGEEDKVAAERRALLQERYTEARGNLTTKVENVLRATVNEYIDPKNVMGKYVKDKAVADTVAAIYATLEKNEPLKKNIDNLWRTAFSNRFDKQSMGRIQATYLGAARRVIANEIKKVRAVVLKDLGKRVKEEKDDDDDDTTREGTSQSDRRTRHAGRPARDTGRGDKNKMRPGESVADFFARD